MALQFKVGDTVTIDHTYVDGTIAPRTTTTERKALLEHLGRIGTSNLIVAKLDAASFLVKVIIIGGTSGRKAWTLRFETENDLNQSFTVVQSVTISTHKIIAENGGNTAIPRGAFVIQTGWTGSNPEVPVIADPPEDEIETSAIFGIAEVDIYPNMRGLVLTQGLFSPINTEGASIDDSCYVGTVNDVVQTMAGCVYRDKAIIVDVDKNGTIYLPAQPAGPYTRMEARSICGIGNNKTNHNWGKSGIALRRITTPTYKDGVGAPVSRVNPRDISNAVCAQTTSEPNSKNTTDYLWAWGQFVDHDIGLTEHASPTEALPITVAGDSHFPPGIIPFSRSEYTGGVTVPRQQINQQSSFIDGSNVYGSNAERNARIRAMDGTGRLRTSGDNLLPKNTTLLPNSPSSSDSLYFLAGDPRANEQLLLIALHTVFMREHNRLADIIRSKNSYLTGDQVYEAARRKNIAIMQHITYNEFLPLLLGSGTISAYTGYKPNKNPGILNCFATAYFRLGHSLVSNQLLRLDSSNRSIAEGPAQLREAYFRPDRLLEGGGIEPLLRGAAQQVCQTIDPRTVDALRNFLFGNPGAGGLDLASLNIQRGRDHGLPPYNQLRADLGLATKSSYNQITSDPAIKAALVSVYSNINEIDAWIGGLAEDLVEGAMVGELIQHVCKMQFEALRDGDRFWFESIFAGDNLTEIKTTTLADVIRRNTDISSELPDNVFVKSA